MQLSGEGTAPELQAQLTELFANMGRAIAALRRADPATISHFEYGVLIRLAPGCTLRPGELADAEGLDPSTMSRRVAALEERGLVGRRPDPEDRRAHRIAITDAGRDLLAASRAAQVALVTDALGDWTPAERDDLARILGRLNDSLVAARPARPPHDAATAAVPAAPTTTGEPA